MTTDTRKRCGSCILVWVLLIAASVGMSIQFDEMRTRIDLLTAEVAMLRGGER